MEKFIYIFLSMDSEVKTFAATNKQELSDLSKFLT